jgi:hypothetical protein
MAHGFLWAVEVIQEISLGMEPLQKLASDPLLRQFDQAWTLTWNCDFGDSVKQSVHIPQCSIDLKKNVLRIGTTGTETAFLSERELPECARLSSQSEDDVIGQSVREAEERDLARALQNSRESGW